MTIDQELFSAAMKRERRGRGWSQADLAQLLRARGLSAHPTTVAKIEAGERAIRLDEAAVIASVLEMTIDDLLAEPRYDQRQALDSFVTVCMEATSEVNGIAERVHQRTEQLRVYPKDMAERSARADDIPDAANADVARSMLALLPANAAVQHLVEAREALRQAISYATASDEQLGDKANPNEVRKAVAGWVLPSSEKEA